MNFLPSKDDIPAEHRASPSDSRLVYVGMWIGAILGVVLLAGALLGLTRLLARQ